MATSETQLDRTLPRQREKAAVAQGIDPGKLVFRVGFVIVLLIFTVLFLYPLVWLGFASLKPGSEVFSGGLVGSALMWSNYPKLISDQPVLQWTWNSVLVTLLAASTVTITSALVAFAFSYFRFPFRNLVFGLVLGSMMLPGAVTMIPNYLIWDYLGWTNTLVPLWAGNLFASPFYIFMLRQFFLGLPRELFDAARVDGANYLRMWWSVALPLTRAALIVVFVFELKVAWTDLVKPLIFLRDLTTFTLPAGLKAIVDNPSIGGEKHFELLAVGGVIVTVPMIIVFFFAQKYFIEGISTTGSTGR
jgi:multiple sugar transport system permease protein